MQVVQFDMILRLLLAGVFGAMIGFERKSRLKEAGLRTHFLVAVGSALIMVVSKYGFFDVLHVDGVELDASRVAAQVVSGIGFLGAGTIIVQRQAVRGLTTAAGLWATSGIGLTVGAGLYWIGLSATILVLIGLEILNRSLSHMIPSVSKMTIHLNERKESLMEIFSLMEQKGVEVTNYQVEYPKNKEYRISLEMNLKMPPSVKESTLITILDEVEGIEFIRMN